MHGSNVGVVHTIKNAAGTSPIPVAGTATVYTPAFVLGFAEAFGVGLLAASDGVVDVLVELEECMSVPTNEAADTDCVEPEGFPDVMNLTDEVMHIKQITPVPAKYGRFKLTGQGSNDASTTVRIELFLQEPL